MLSLRVDIPPIASVRHSASGAPVTDYAVAPSSMADLIRRLTHAPERLESAVAGLSLAECERAICVDEQPIRSCVEHVAVYSLDWSELLYRSVSHIYPTHRSANSHWKDRLTSEAMTGMSAALGVFRKHNRSVAEFLATLPASDFERPFTAKDLDGDPFLVKDSIHWGLVEHCDYHLATIHKMRIALGKPLDWMAVYFERYSRPN
jgi:hypothetical protein